VSDAEIDLSPEAVLARATAARGDIFPEWKTLVYASPKTYHLINQTVRLRYDAAAGARCDLLRGADERHGIGDTGPARHAQSGW
jgi:hypothetical protein